MPYVVCSFCGGGATQSLDIGVCMRCLELNDPKIQIFAIKKYLQQNPDAKYDEISKRLKISRERMNKFIEDGSLELVYKDGEKAVSTENDKQKSEESLEEKRKKLLNELAAKSRNSQNTPHVSNFGRSQLVTDLERRKNNSDEGR